jgi:hypothetical protein
LSKIYCQQGVTYPSEIIPEWRATSSRRHRRNLQARYDGLFVLRTNARITPLQAVLRYRDLLQVEDLFRRAKAILRTRPSITPRMPPSAAMCSARFSP